MKKSVVALAGNPNCGKTTLFNQLTGSKQYVGNWAGVTVEKKEGAYTFENQTFQLVDLPGIYSLSPYSMEEIVSRNFVLHENPDVVLNIIDGTNLERNLYLTLQLMELGIPVVLAINMMDEVKSKGDTIDAIKLSKILGVPVVPIVARKNENINALLQAIARVCENQKTTQAQLVYNRPTQNAVNAIVSEICSVSDFAKNPIFYACKLLEKDHEILSLKLLSEQQLLKIENIGIEYEKTSKYGDRETMLADARYRFITQTLSECTVKNSTSDAATLSDKIDGILTNKYLAIPMFLLIMFGVFSVTFGIIGTTLSGGVSFLIEDVISNNLSNYLVLIDAPIWTQGLLIDGIIGGVGGILTFLPQIMLLFLFLSILEDSGYMARAAFIMDRLLRKLGLSGKSFIPMLMGFGCTTPAVMCARSLEDEKARKLTIMITPFMSCGARLPIYALFATAFFDKYRGVVVFSMYILGMIIAIVAGLFLKSTLFKGDSSTFLLELPTYRLPTPKSVVLHMWDKAKGFLMKAGTVIFAMSVMVWLLQNFNFSLQMVEDSTQSIFGQFGMLIAPIFVPLGFGTWQASVSLLTGLIAKESVVSTMCVLYAAANTQELIPILANLFTPASALAFMTFSLLYMPCISAFVTIKNEMNSMKWALGTALFQTGVAYVVAMFVYQIANVVL